MSVIENMKLPLTNQMKMWLDNIRHKKGLYYMMYDKKSIAKFGKRFSLDGKNARSAIADWYSSYGD